MIEIYRDEYSIIGDLILEKQTLLRVYKSNYPGYNPNDIIPFCSYIPDKNLDAFIKRYNTKDKRILHSSWLMRKLTKKESDNIKVEIL